MHALLLQAVLPGLREALLDRPVTGVQSAGKYAVILRFGGERRSLWLSAHPELSRLGLLERLPAGYEPRPAPDNLAAPLLRARLTGVEQEARGRVAVLRFAQDDARHRAPRLVAELIPRFANLILVGTGDRALWTKREFAGEHRREVAAGRPYVFPEADAGVAFPDLDAATLEERLAAGDGPLHRRVPRGWGGGKDGFARALEEADPAPDAFARRLLALAAAARAPAPRLARSAADGSVVLFPHDPGDLPGWTVLPPRDPAEVADTWYRAREEAEAADALLGDLRRVLVKRRGRAAKALRAIEERQADAAREAELRGQAELLAAHLGRVKRGMASVTLPAFDGSGDVTIPLDPKKDARGNLDALFRRARRLARGQEELEAQLAQQSAELETVDAALAALDPAPPVEALLDLARAHAPGLLSPGGSPPRPGAPAEGAEGGARASSLPAGFTPRVYVLPGGWEVWVGRNARQNDELTHRHASQKDLWFHARGSQGSHTVLRVSSGKGEPPREIVEAAASIAAFHSRARNSKLVPVAYTEKRYVRRARGAPAGTALMMREKVLMVEPKEPTPATSE